MMTIRQLQTLLRITYGVMPIVAGLDKFTNLLTHWSDYLGLRVKALLPVDPLLFMKIVGVIEIIAGLLVIIRPVTGAYVVIVWLICIAIELMIGGFYFDVALRDLVMAIGAFTLAQLTLISNDQLPL
jgi:uncharacterized membrane protein YphA (DoxX/SURF4 family)